MKKLDVAIIGGGAAGLACAATIVKNSACAVALVESDARLGKKLSKTGNGQGNISNANLAGGHYFGGNSALAEKICLMGYNRADLFDCLFETDDKGRVYPTGRQASALTDSLRRRVDGKVAVFTGVTAVKIGRGFNIELSDGENIAAEYVVLCTGGSAQPVGKASPYDLARAFGHTTTKIYPSLVQLKTDTKYIRTLKGIRVDCRLSAISGGKTLKTVRGDVIFTDFGVSGNAVFSISPYVTDKPSAILSIEFLPDIPAETVLENLETRKNSGQSADELLSGTLHNTVGRAVIARTEHKSPAEIAAALKNFTLEYRGTLGFDMAQVTRGGIKMNEVTDALESKLQKNLFFAGEVLDVDGDCGGYNLQWAFSGGVLVGEEISKRLKK